MKSKSALLRYSQALHPLSLWVLGLCLLVLSTCNVEEGVVDEIVPADVDPTPTQLQLSSRGFENGGYLPHRYHYTGFSEGAQNLAPPLEWSQVSEEAKSLLLFMYDHDALDWHHWLIYDIPRTTQGILDGSNVENYLNASALVGGAVAIQGGTDKGYYGPSPPSGIHTYTIMLVELQDESIALSSDDQSRTVSRTDQSELGNALLEFINNQTPAIEYHGTSYPVLEYRTLEFKVSLEYPAFETPSSIAGKAGETIVTIAFKKELGGVDNTKISVDTGESIDPVAANPITSTSIDGEVLTLHLAHPLQLGDHVVVSFETGAVTNKESGLSNPALLTISTQLIEFTLSIAGMEEGEELPLSYRSDGEAQSPPLDWAYPPTNTKSFVLLLYHDDIDVDKNHYGDGKHFWLLYNIPATLSSLNRNVNPQDYNIGMIQGGNQYGYRPPVLSAGTKPYRLVIVALDRMISKANVEYNYQPNYQHPAKLAPGDFFNDNKRTSDSEGLAGLAYAIIDYLEGKRTDLRYEAGVTSNPYKVLGTASFDMTVSYHASSKGPKLDMGYYNYLLNHRNTGPFVVLEGYRSNALNNQIFLVFDEIVTLEDASKFIIKKSTANGNRQVIPTAIAPLGQEDKGFKIILGTTDAPVLTSPFDEFEITVQAGAVKNKGNYFNQDISLNYTVQVPKIMGTNNYYLDLANQKLGILFEFPVMAPYFVNNYIFNKTLFYLSTGPVNKRSANTITSIVAKGSVLELGYTSAIHLNDEIYVSIDKSAIIDAEMGYPNYRTLTFRTTVPAATPKNTYPVLETDVAIQNKELGVANPIHVDLTSGTIRVLFNEAIALVDASRISVQSKLPDINAYRDLPFRTDHPVEIIGTNHHMVSLHLAEAISKDVSQLQVKINASAVQSIRSGVNNYYIVIDHDVYVPQLIDTDPLATSIATKTVSLSFKRGVAIVDRTKISASRIGTDGEQTALPLEGRSIQVAGNNQDIVQFELPVFPTVGETLTVTLAAGALKDSATHYGNTTIEASKKYEGALPRLDNTFQAHLYSLSSPVDIPHNNKYIYLVFDTEEDLEIIETGLNKPYHLPYSLISIRRGMDRKALRPVEFLKGTLQDGMAMNSIPSVTQQTPVKGMLTLMIDGRFNTNGEHVEIVIEPGVVRNSAGANEKIIINTQIVVPSVQRITAARDATSITMEFNREVIYINPCLSLLETMFALLQTEPVPTVTGVPASESIISIYDDGYVDTISPDCNYNYDTNVISGQRSIAVYRSGKAMYPDLRISDDHRTITLMLSTPITESSLSFDIITLGIADRYSKQAMDNARYTVTIP